MSKLDQQRAMREARMARLAKDGPGKLAARPNATPAAKKAVPAPTAAKKATVKKAEAKPAEAEELCGHRNMGGRSCTREQGHAAKSHRYS